MRFFADGACTQRLLNRHSLNDRNQADTRSKYKAIIMTRGIAKGSRSESIAVPDGSRRLNMLSRASF
eukprot:10406011-Alexandrium_andersonii.AAC.1